MAYKLKNILIIVVLLFSLESYSQVPGLPDLPYTKKDSTIIFESPRSLIEYSKDRSLFPHHLGPHFTFSGHGLGVGGFYNYTFSDNWSFTAKLSISNGIANDELETFNSSTGLAEVRDKINRLYLLPVDLSLRYFPFENDVESSFRPFVIGGASPFFIVSTPYRVGRRPDAEVVGFFSSFSEPESYVRIGANIGIGANWGDNPKRDNKFEIIYYILPFGGNGIESRWEEPILDFGGLFISVSLGFDL